MMTDQRIPPPAAKDEKLENAVEELCQFAAKLKNSKQTEDQIQKRLTDAGLGLKDAKVVMSVGLARMGKDRRAGRKNLLLGILRLVGSGVIVLATSGAALSAIRNLVVYGATLVGVLQMLLGLVQILRAPRGRNEVRDIVQRVISTINTEDSSRWKIAAIKIHNP